ncbi:HlyD family secretion protein [Arenibacter certesii]|nr:biotin/lipoyl-binding protein [Arenibacter certesii]
MHKSIFIGCFASLFLMGCNSNKEITDLRGKVKFETLSISSKLAGRIAEVYVTEGQKVKQGDTLALIDVPEIGAKLFQADGAVLAAQGQLNMANNGATTEQLEQIKSQVEASKAQLKFAEESLNRMTAMYKDSLVTAQAFEETQMKVDMARAQLKAMEAKQQEVTVGTRQELLAQAKGQLDRAEGAKKEVLIAADEKYIIAPTDMSIETITLNPGELASPGYTLFNGYQTNTVYYRFTVSESKIYNYKIGQTLTVVNPYTNEESPSKITAIKQLPRYADITSTSPLYKLDEAIYELKLVPENTSQEQQFFINATVLLK